MTLTSGAAPPPSPLREGIRGEQQMPARGGEPARVPAPRPPVRGGESLRRGALAAGPSVALGVAVLALWQVAHSLGAAPSLFLPAPADVGQAFWQLVTLPQFRGSILATVFVSLGGCALGAVCAIPLGYLIARSKVVATTVQPYVAASQALPVVALAPLIALWLGYGFEPRLVICALIVFFPLVITTTLGLRGLDGDILDAARVEGADRWALLWQIELPLALPSILAGLRASLTLSITGAVIGDFVLGGEQGLGGILIGFFTGSDSAGVFATLLLLALLASIYYGLARLAERRFSYLEAR